MKKENNIKANVLLIEKTLDVFGIKSRVVEVNNNESDIQYAIEIVMGTKLDDIIALNKDLAIALAAPGGKVDIQAPIPGRSLVGITVSKRKNELVDTPSQKYKIIKVVEQKEELITYDNVERIRTVISTILTMLANLLVQIANKIDSKANISWQKVDKPK